MSTSQDLLDKLRARFPDVEFVDRSGFVAVDNLAHIKKLRRMFPRREKDTPAGYEINWNGYFSSLLVMRVSADLYGCEKAVLFELM